MAGTGVEHASVGVAGSDFFHRVQKINVISTVVTHIDMEPGNSLSSLWSSPKPITQSNHENRILKNSMMNSLQHI